MADARDIPEDTGKAPPFAHPEPGMGEIGTHGGYSGQEYDGDGQAEWRDSDRRLGVSRDGEAHGTGSPGEEYEPETSGGSEDSPVGAGSDEDGSR